MNTNALILYLDHLQPDEEMAVSYTIDPAFLDFNPKDEVQPSRPVVVEGTCSLVDDFVILNLLVKAFFSVHCAHCNEQFEYEVCIDHFAHQELLENIEQKKWNLSEIVREAIVLELPFFPQCGGKKCLHIDELRKYFHVQTQEKDEGNSSPFQSFFDTVQ